MKCRKLIISICTVFLVFAVSYTVYNYVTPISSNNMSNNVTNSIQNEKFTKGNTSKNINQTVQPFKLSENDIEKEVSTDINKNKLQNEKRPEEEKLIKYEVQQGDTLFSLTRRYMPYMDTYKAIATLKEMNGICDNQIIKSGEVLSIPTYDSPNVKNTNTSGYLSTLKYMVKPGDTLFKIAKNYMSWCDSREGVLKIIGLNKLQNAGLIKEGQELIIPCNVED